MTAQYTETDCRAIFAAVGKQKIRFSIESNKMSVLDFLYGGTSQCVLPPPYAPVLFFFVIIFSWLLSVENVVWKTPWERSCTGFIGRTTLKLQFLSVVPMLETIRMTKKWQLKFFLPEDPLEYVGKRVLRTVLSTIQSNQSVVSMMKSYINLSKALRTSKNVTMVTNIFVDEWVSSYGIKSKLLTKKDPQFVSSATWLYVSQLAE